MFYPLTDLSICKCKQASGWSIRLGIYRIGPYLNFKTSRTVTSTSICNYMFWLCTAFYDVKKPTILHLCLARAVLVKILVDKDVGYKILIFLLKFYS